MNAAYLCSEASKPRNRRARTARFVGSLAMAGVLGITLWTDQANALTGKPVLHAHRAIYDMSLGESDDTSGISGVTGRMVFEFSGSACEGYTVNFRFLTRIESDEGASRVTDLRTSSFEKGDGGAFQFINKTYIDKVLAEESHGQAERDGDEISVDLERPKKEKFGVQKTALFPTEHLLEIISKAQQGTNFLQADVYDGSEDGHKVFATTSVIGGIKSRVQPVNDENEVGVGALEGMKYWPVTIAYFDLENERQGETTPIYELEFELFENGVSGGLNMKYGDFTVRGELKEIEFLASEKCE
ncbi:MAG: cell envelope integrity EipB family protein [Stappiaceae bacterium]